MSHERVAHLRRRRMLLQLRIERSEEARHFRELAPRLREQGARRLSRLPAVRTVGLMQRYGRLQLRDERIDWGRLHGHAITHWDTPAERDRAFAAALRDCFEPSTRLAVVFHTAESALVLSCGDAIALADVLLPRIRDTLWVVALRPHPALVEVSFIDTQVCWHRSLAAVTGHG